MVYQTRIGIRNEFEDVSTEEGSARYYSKSVPVPRNIYRSLLGDDVLGSQILSERFREPSFGSMNKSYNSFSVWGETTRAQLALWGFGGASNCCLRPTILKLKFNPSVTPVILFQNCVL
jgi:hypothetical protein